MKSAAQPLDADQNVRKRLPISQRLIELVRNKPVHEADLQQAVLLTLDAVANMVAGSNSPQGRKIIGWARGCGRNAGLAGLDAGRKAFVLGALCHILEVDDLHRASVVHPGCAVVPAVLAMGQEADGLTTLNAVLQGIEAACRVGMAVGRAHYKIWHNTATCGPFGSAIAVSHLLGLNNEQTCHALGNAGSQSAGLWEFLDTGAETKHMHAGRAAEAGLVAAELAQAGLTGAPRIFEGERGFFRAVCPDGDAAAIIAQPDADWQANMTSIKPWPSCRHTHPAIDCALQLNGELNGAGHGIDDVSQIDVHTYQAAMDLCDRPEPASIYAAKFSLQHCVAAALQDGEVWFDSFDGPARQRLGALRSIVNCRALSLYDEDYPVHWGSEVVLTWPDGRREAHSIKDAKGDPEAAIDEIGMGEKADKLLRFGGLDEPEGLIDAILGLPSGGELPDIIGLVDELTK